MSDKEYARKFQVWAGSPAPSTSTRIEEFTIEIETTHSNGTTYVRAYEPVHKAHDMRTTTKDRPDVESMINEVVDAVKRQIIKLRKKYGVADAARFDVKVDRKPGKMVTA